MIRFLTVLFGCCVLTACSSESGCKSKAILIADKFESQLFVDKAKDRHGFLNFAQKMKSDLGSEENAFSLLQSENLSEMEKKTIIDEFGSLLLMMAISNTDMNRVTFYLEKGVDSLTYQPHIGVLVLDLLEVKDRNTFRAFRTFYDRNNLSSDAFDEVEAFYRSCVR